MQYAVYVVESIHSTSHARLAQLIDSVNVSTAQSKIRQKVEPVKGKQREENNLILP